VRDVLDAANYNVLVANDGLDGFQTVISGKPHVILTDKVMPKFDGFSLLASIRAIPEIQSVPVILMSDKLTPEEEMKVFDRGFFDYRPKPINSITLISRVKRAFRFNDQKYDFF
jgi:PleD family two-component response regulator